MRLTRRTIFMLGAWVLAAGAGSGLVLWHLTQHGTIVVGDKTFTENRILAEIISQSIEAEGIAVDRRQFGSTTLVWKGIQCGVVDIYPEYTGTLLTHMFQQPPIPDPAEALRTARALLPENLELLDPFGLNDTYALAVTAATAQAKGLKKISDLRAHPELRPGFCGEFLVRPDGYSGVAKHYGISFNNAPVDILPSQCLVAMEKGILDISAWCSTDARIRKFNLVVLEDDRRFFPAYQALPLVRAETARRFPGVIRRLRALAGKIDDETMLKMNYAVDVDGVSIAKVARDFLRQGESR